MDHSGRSAVLSLRAAAPLFLLTRMEGAHGRVNLRRVGRYAVCLPVLA